MQSMAEVCATLVPLDSQMRGSVAAAGTAVPSSDRSSAVLPDLVPDTSPRNGEEIAVLSADEGDLATSSACTGPDRRIPKLSQRRFTLVDRIIQPPRGASRCEDLCRASVP